MASRSDLNQPNVAAAVGALGRVPPIQQRQPPLSRGPAMLGGARGAMRQPLPAGPRCEQRGHRFGCGLAVAWSRHVRPGARA